MGVTRELARFVAQSRYEDLTPAAVDAAKPGDTVVVAPGTYRESVRLRPRVALRSAGDDAPGAAGLRRAEATVIDGGKDAKQPGVLMAEGSTLDGFTVTNVGTYDEAVWKKHFDSQGEELGDEEGAVRAEGTNPAVSVVGVNCTVTRCVVHHNGDVGIGVLGKAGATTEPLVTGNLVYRNMGGGIGVAEGAEPVVRGNTCKENLRAGIGCRKANPVVTGNTCSHNVRAGIGVREGASTFALLHGQPHRLASYDVNQAPNALTSIGNLTMLGLVAAALVLLEDSFARIVAAMATKL